MGRFNGQRVLVTGGAGFIGSNLVRKLCLEGAEVSIVDDFSRGSLANIYGAPYKKLFTCDLAKVNCGLLDPTDPNHLPLDLNYIFDLAALVGGIKYLRSNEAIALERNCRITLNVLDFALRLKELHGYLFTSSACMYPENIQTAPDAPLLKEEFAYPANPDSNYGWSKLLGEKLTQSFAKDYGFPSAIVRMFNVFGPYEDFHLKRAHVIPALITKSIKHPNPPMSVFGSGRATRAFLYVDDAVEGLIKTMLKVRDARPVNIGNSERHSIAEITSKIITLSGKEITPQFLENESEGVVGRGADNSLAKELLNWEPTILFDDGLKRTYEYGVKVVQ